MKKLEVKEKLNQLVSHYGELDNQIKTLTKEFDSDKVTIKNLMGDNNIDDCTAGGYTVTRQVSYRTKYNEDKMLDILKADWKQRYGDIECPYIKTKEVVDMDALEAVIYANELPNEVMMKLNDCQEKTEVVALKCTKAKAPKKE